MLMSDSLRSGVSLFEPAELGDHFSRNIQNRSDQIGGLIISLKSDCGFIGKQDSFC